MRFLPIIALLLGVAALSPTAGAGDDKKKPPPKKPAYQTKETNVPELGRAWETKTKFFTIINDMGAEKGDELGPKADMLVNGHIAFFKDLKIPLKTPPTMKIYYVAKKETYNNVVRAFQKAAPSSMYGIAYSGSMAAYFNEEMCKTLGPPYKTLFHEGTHLLAGLTIDGVRHTTPHYWMEEALGCYFETMTENEGKFEWGKETMWALQGKKQYVKLSTFISWDSKAFYAKVQSMGFNVVYGQAVALFHFFMNGEGGKHKAKFAKYLRAFLEGQAEAATFDQAFGVSVDKFEDAFIDHANKIYVGAKIKK